MNTPANTPKAKTTPEGTWTIATAKTLNGATYSGTVQIQPMGQIYTVSWLTSLGDFAGLAFFQDGYLFAGCGFDESYGVTLYQINNDGTLDGKWTTPANKGAIDWEKAINETPNGVEGFYKIRGNSSKIGSYEGNLNLSQSNGSYQLAWFVGTEYRGVGLRAEDWLITSWGEGDVFCLCYEIQGSKAKGRWSVSNQVGIGEEILEKIC